MELQSILKINYTTNFSYIHIHRWPLDRHFIPYYPSGKRTTISRVTFHFTALKYLPRRYAVWVFLPRIYIFFFLGTNLLSCTFKTSPIFKRVQIFRCFGWYQMQYFFSSSFLINVINDVITSAQLSQNVTFVANNPFFLIPSLGFPSLVSKRIHRNTTLKLYAFSSSGSRQVTVRTMVRGNPPQSSDSRPTTVPSHLLGTSASGFLGGILGSITGRSVVSR